MKTNVFGCIVARYLLPAVLTSVWLLAPMAVVAASPPVYSITDTGTGFILSPELQALLTQSFPVGIPAASYAEIMDFDPGLSLQVTVPGFVGPANVYEPDPYEPGAFDLIAPAGIWFNNGNHGLAVWLLEGYPAAAWMNPASVPLPSNGEIGILLAANGATLGPLYFVATPDSGVSSIWLLVLALTGMYGVSRFTAMRTA